MFHYTVETDKTVHETIQSLERTLQEEKFGVLWQFDIQETLREKGFDFDSSYHVLEVCRPSEAQRVLNLNKMAGYFLPCKIIVYEDGGKTKIGLPKPTSLIDMVGDPSLQAIAEDVERRLITSIEKSK